MPDSERERERVVSEREERERETALTSDGRIVRPLTFCAPSLPVTRSIKSVSFMDSVQFPFRPAQQHVHMCQCVSICGERVDMVDVIYILYQFPW